MPAQHCGNVLCWGPAEEVTPYSKPEFKNRQVNRTKVTILDPDILFF